jgi:hypothetical protein
MGKVKVKIGNLPNGYKFKNGKIVKVMSTGGAPYSNSLGPIPRTFANLEAEKGETALTDLTNDGNFELYNIGGKRHPDGGTALSLPPQSFIFSDTAKMKLNKEQLKRFDINSTKKMSPAKVSKKFPLNKYYSVLNGEFVDDIATRSAEMMLEKNKMKLSELAFVSESKKKFEDGVPLAAYPYLMSQDIDPMEFVQKVNQLNEEQAQMQMIDQLPPEQQQEILALQNFTGGQGGPPPQGGMPPMGPPMAGGMPPMPPGGGGGMPPQGMMPPQQMMAKYGGGLPRAQTQLTLEQIAAIEALNHSRMTNRENTYNKNINWQEEFAKQGYWRPPVAPGFDGTTPNLNVTPVSEYTASGPWDKTFTGQNELSIEKYGGGLRRAQFQTPENIQPQMHLPSQRLAEVADMVPFDPSEFKSDYPKISYGKDINQGVNQGSLVKLAENILNKTKGTPDGMYDRRYKEDPQGDYAQIGGALNRFIYGGQDYLDRYRDYDDLQKFQKDGELLSAYATRMGQTWDPQYKDATYDKSTKMWVYSDGTPSVSNADMRKNALDPNFVPPDEYRVDGGHNANGVIIDENAEEGQGGNFVNGVWVPGPNDNSNNGSNNNGSNNNAVVSSYPGQKGHNSLVELYGSDDWDLINDYTYQTYKKMYDGGKYDMGPEMSAEEFEATLLRDQKFKALMHDPTALENITITLGNGKTVSGADIIQHGAWDHPTNHGFTSNNDMYRAVYEQLATAYPEAELPALPPNDANGNKLLTTQVRQQQATFSSFGGLQKHADKLAADGDPSFQNLLKNVNLDATGRAGGGSGLMGEASWSKIDGNYGDTFNSQRIAFKNTPGKDKENPVETCYTDQNGTVFPDKAKAKLDCEMNGGTYDTMVCECIEKTTTKIPQLPPKEFWKQDKIKIGALSGLDLNKYYPSRQAFTGNFMDPAYKDPTREIAAIGEQAQIAGDMAAMMSSGPALASVLSKIQGTAGSQIANALDKVQNDNISIYNNAEQYNAGVQTNTDVLNQDAAKVYMDAVNLVDQNYDNAKNKLRVELADAHANAWTNRANTYNLNTLTPNYNVDPSDGGSINITNPKSFFAQDAGDPASLMQQRIALENEYIANRCGNLSTEAEKVACMNNAKSVVDGMLKNSSGPANTKNIHGYPGNSNDITVNENLPDGQDNGTEEGNTKKSKYGSELRNALRMRRGGQWW